MDQGPLVNEEIEAGARFLAEFQKYAPVQAAFWLKRSDEGECSLYVASDQITDDNFDVAYGEVVRISGEMQDPYFDMFRVKLIGADDPLARAALEVHRRYAGARPTRFRGNTFGGVGVDEVYIYPTPLPIPVK
jgi:hypothetical protein